MLERLPLPAETDAARRALAIAAASQAADALAELLRYAREGGTVDGLFEGDCVEQLLDAAKLAIEIEDQFDGPRGQAYAAIANYLEGWA